MKNHINFWNWYNNNSSWIKNLLLILFFSGIIFLLFESFTNYAEKRAVKYLAPLETVDSILSFQKEQLIKIDSIAKLKSYIELIKAEKEHHKVIFTDLFSYYYATILTLNLLSVIASIFVFIIVSKGWNDTVDYIKILFFVLAVGIGYFGLFPTIFDQKGTIEKNLTNYVQYSKIQYKIYNYSMTELNAASDTTMNKLLMDISYELINIKGLYFGMDHSSLNLKNPLENITKD